VDQVWIRYSTDGGASWSTVARFVNAADGQRAWVIPDEVSASCLVQIRDMSEATVIDMSDGAFAIVSTTGTGDDPSAIPVELALMQNHPNPFNPSTVIEYHLPERSEVEIVVYDLAGKVACQLLGGTQNAGRYSVRWDGHIYRLRSEGQTITRKMVLLR
jgi:hypothetical protein